MQDCNKTGKTREALTLIYDQSDRNDGDVILASRWGASRCRTAALTLNLLLKGKEVEIPSQSTFTQQSSHNTDDPNSVRGLKMGTRD